VLFDTNFWRKLIYTAWAPAYDLLAAPFAPVRRRSIGRLGLARGERVLLVGAGTGLDLDALPPGVAVTAVDLTPAMLAKLRARARRLGVAVDARVMNAQAMTGLADASYDAAVLHLILAVVPDPVACVRETARVLRPGGRAVILDKFLPDDARTPLALRLLSPVLSCFGTEATRRLGPILAGSGLRLVSNEAAGFGGYLRMAVVERPAAGP